MLRRPATIMALFLAIILVVVLVSINYAAASTEGSDSRQAAASAPAPTPASTPSAIVPPVPSVYPDGVYSLAEERQIGEYTIRRWENKSPNKWVGSDIVTISAPAQPTVQIETVWQIDDLTGADITAQGYPDLVIHTYSGGAHCCFSTIIYQLGPTLTKILETPQSNCGGNLLDLDGDGVYEYVTCDDSFAYKYCCYAGSPMVRAVLKYEPDRGYVLASPEFAELYANDIAASMALAKNGEPGGNCEWDETTKCSVLPVVLNYLYAGQPDEAWAALYRLYPYDDVDDFRAEIEQVVSGSPLFVCNQP